LKGAKPRKKGEAEPSAERLIGLLPWLRATRRFKARAAQIKRIAMAFRLVETAFLVGARWLRARRGEAQM